MARRLLLSTILAMTLTGSALAAGSVTCSVTPAVGGCYYERIVAELFGVEFAVGVDAQAAWGDGRTGHLAPYGSIAYYAPTWSAWLEVFMPQAAPSVPIVGRSDWFRLGFTWRVP